MPVEGIGGLFFRADDPKALSAWYLEHLGIPSGHDVWQQEAGPTVLTPFKKTSDYFPVDRQWMLNLRVSGLRSLLEKLTAGGVEIVQKPDWENTEYGTFARIHDPEGNAIELWEPPPA